MSPHRIVFWAIVPILVAVWGAVEPLRDEAWMTGGHLGKDLRRLWSSPWFWHHSLLPGPLWCEEPPPWASAPVNTTPHLPALTDEILKPWAKINCFSLRYPHTASRKAFTMQPVHRRSRNRSTQLDLSSFLAKVPNTYMEIKKKKRASSMGGAEETGQPGAEEQN